VVALGANATLPDGRYGLTASDIGLDGGFGLSGADRQSLADRASRGDARDVPLTTSDQAAPKIWLLPLHRDYTVTSPFGMRWGVLHPGTDLAVPEGTPYYAAAAGTVILCRWNGGYGYNIMIDHGSGIVSVYGHSSKLLCHEGQHVQAGDLIGLTGNTGFSTGPHLHYEIRINDQPIDAVPFMLARGVDIMNKTATVDGNTMKP
jgi:murein DD-endopeptidase MepM/ murein hydrolase activator NlpD